MLKRKNKKAQWFAVGIMMFLGCLITVIAMIPVVKMVLQDGRTSVGCTDLTGHANASLDVFDSGLCIVMSFTFLYFIGSGILLAVAYLSMKRIL
jgi:hypothetical protein